MGVDNTRVTMSRDKPFLTSDSAKAEVNMTSPRALRREISGILAMLASAMMFGCGGSKIPSPANSGPTNDLSIATTIYAANESSSSLGLFSATASGSVNPTNTLNIPTAATLYSVATDSAGQVYVGAGTVYGYQVLIYPAGATNSTSATRTLNLSSAPFAIFVDGQGQIYVASYSSVLIYGATASGSASAIRTIQVANTSSILDVYADSSGNVYLAIEANPTNSIQVFGPTAAGHATPIQSISSSYLITGVAADSNGDIFANSSVPNGVSLLEFAPGASGTATPAVTISLQSSLTYSFPGAVRRDPAGNIYATSTLGSVTTFAAYAPGVTSTSKPFASFSTTFYPVTTQTQIAVN